MNHKDILKMYPLKLTKEQEVLKHVIEDMEKEVQVFEEIYNKDDDFYSDYSNVSYIIYLNSIARIKEVLFRMSINNKENA
tara:strand:+ start:3058 stop:3297 length:240 start_codon:yes stop_codon:yes gene_type:complete